MKSKLGDMAPATADSLQGASFAEKGLVPADELNERVIKVLDGYYLIGVRRDKESFYALSEEDLKDRYGCVCGLFLNYVM